MPYIYAEKLTRTAREAIRHDGQFDLMTRTIGYLIHPRIASVIPTNARIADIGTGTDHFLRCVKKSRLFPDAVLDGYDISNAMYAETRADDNITLRVMDMKAPFSAELHGTYDLMYARMLVAAVLPAEWTAVVPNVIKLLKPGGWMQWGECDFISAKFLRAGEVESAQTDTVIKLSDMWHNEMRERFECGWSTLPGDMRAAGLDVVESDCVSADRVPETRNRRVVNAMISIFSWLRMLAAKRIADSLSDEELDVAEKRAHEEIESGTYVRYEIYVVSGQKPL